MHCCVLSMVLCDRVWLLARLLGTNSQLVHIIDHIVSISLWTINKWLDLRKAFDFESLGGSRGVGHSPEMSLKPNVKFEM